MDLLKLQKLLLAAARGHAPDGQVPYAFEQRIMARLAERQAPDAWAGWVRGLTRAAAFCVAITLFLSLVSMNGHDSGDSLSQDLDQTLFASVESGAGDATIETW